MIRATGLVGVLLSVLTLASGFLTIQASLLAGVLGGIGLLWLAAQWFHWRWLGGLSLLLLVSEIGFGLLIGVSPVRGLLSLSAGLLAWDMMNFYDRLQQGHPDDDHYPLIRRHFQELGVFLLTGTGLGLFALNGQVRFTFWQAFFLVVITGGILFLVRWLMRETPPTNNE